MNRYFRIALHRKLAFLTLMSSVCVANSSSLDAQDAVTSTPTQPLVDTSLVVSKMDIATKSSATEPISSLITQFSADQRTLSHRFRISIDPIAIAYRNDMLDAWTKRLDEVDFAKLDQDQKLDWLMLSTHIRHLKSKINRVAVRNEAALPLIPYHTQLLRICSTKEHGLPMRADEIATTLDAVTKQANELVKELQAKKKSKRDSSTEADESGEPAIAPTTAIHAADLLDQLLRNVSDMHRYYEGYDPQYSWWANKPYEAAKQAIGNHRKAIREVLAGLDDSDPDKIVGLPIGPEALAEDIRDAWIPYSPEELIRIGEQELEWCDARFREAADELGVEGDWKRALDLVKSRHVEPGEQPKLIRELAWEAVRFLEANDLLTIPDMAKNGWRVEMMSPEAQRVNPYFLGGDNIIVSFPTSSMTQDEKRMSLRSNNIHFCRATVHHELIPGHHLQYYVLPRYRPYRELFDSPFWMEGWALYWEMLLWDLNFHQSAEDRVGMLFWRRHRAARIIFSLNYQSGKWTAEECVQYLIDRVGHEPTAAAAEVRRSIMGGYGPLYQAGYMLGGLQLRAMHKELVQGGKMTNRQFHDAVLQENFIPFELLRAKFIDQPLTKESLPAWQFYSFKD